MGKGYPDFEGNKRGVYLEAEWAAYEGYEWIKMVPLATKVWGAYTYVYYTVPAGLTLYIVSHSFYIHALLEADADNNCIGYMTITDFTSGIQKSAIGGNGGASKVYSTPIKIPSEHQVGGQIYNMSNHSCRVCGTMWGYEI